MLRAWGGTGQGLKMRILGGKTIGDGVEGCVGDGETMKGAEAIFATSGSGGLRSGEFRGCHCRRVRKAEGIGEFKETETWDWKDAEVRVLRVQQALGGVYEKNYATFVTRVMKMAAKFV